MDGQTDEYRNEWTGRQTNIEMNGRADRHTVNINTYSGVAY